MKYFDTTFWKMSLGFLVLIILGLAGVYAVDKWSIASEAAVDNPVRAGIFESEP